MAAWLGSLVMLLVGTTAMADDPQQRVNQPQALVFERAQAEIALKTEVFQRTVGREHVDWSVDLDEGVIRFTAPGLAAHAPVQVIGTYNTLDGTFLWAWDHPSIPEARRTDAMLARSFGEHNHLPLFTTRKVACTQQQAWQFTAVARYVSAAEGAYRARSGTTLVFMTFGTVRLARRAPN